MGSFTIKRPALLLLLGILAIITLILILPQVDLLDTAFQRNTSPLALRARVTFPPLLLIPAFVTLLAAIATIFMRRGEQALAVARESRAVAKYSLRC